MTVISSESVDAPSDGNSRARKRPRKGKSLPTSKRMTSDLELEGDIVRIFKGF